MHGVVTLLVGAGLVVINATVASAFPWSAFAVGGMLAHWWFGYVKLDDQLTGHQQKTEIRVATRP